MYQPITDKKLRRADKFTTLDVSLGRLIAYEVFRYRKRIGRQQYKLKIRI